MQSSKKWTADEIRQKANQMIPQQTGWSKYDLEVRLEQLLDPKAEAFLTIAKCPDAPNAAAHTIWFDPFGEVIPQVNPTRLASLRVAPPTATARSTKRSTGSGSVAISPKTNVLQLAEGDTFNEQIFANISGVLSRQIDVYFLADTTGSMSAYLSSVQANINSIISFLSSTGHDVAYGVGNYKDFPSDSYAFGHQLAPTTDLSLVYNEVSKWWADGGGDEPEAQLYALYQLAADPSIGWRVGSKKIVFWFGDAPGHEPICAAYTGLGFDLSEWDVLAALQSAQITVVAGSIGSTLDNDPLPISNAYTACSAGGAAGQASRLTSGTGGVLADGLDASGLVNAAYSVLPTVMNTASWIQLVPSGATAGFVTGIYPSYYGPIDLTVPQNLAFDVTFVGNVPCQAAPQVLYGTIDLLVDGVLFDQKTVEITVPACADGTTCACDHRDDAAQDALLNLSNQLCFTIPATANPFSSVLPATGAVCDLAPLPDLRPTFFLKWGNGARDQFETEDFEVVLLTVCNPYRNLTFGYLHLYNLRVVLADGSPVPNLPDGTPSVIVVPSHKICLDDIAACTCIQQQLVVKSAGAVEGPYKIIFDYCIEDIKWTCVEGVVEFPIDLVNS
jgi:hypothetical protein